MALNIASKLVKARSKKGWSIRYLAEKAGIDPLTVFRIESRGKIPSVNTLIKLGKALKVAPAWFLQ